MLQLSYNQLFNHVHKLMLPKLKYQWNAFARLLLIGILITKVSAGTLGVLTYEIIGGTEVEITDCDYGTAGSVIIPDLIESLPVTSIDDYAFSYRSNITSITIPASINNIGSSAFSNCSKLTTIDIPAGVTSISRSTFSGCSDLVTVGFPTGIKSIGPDAFNRCESLAIISLPSSLELLGSFAFAGCDSITSMTIHGGITILEQGVFSRCDGLTDVVIAYGVTEIDTNAFGECVNLVNVSLPDSLLTIGFLAFPECSSLVNITIPASVISWSSLAFEECTSLININVDIGNPLYTSIDGVVFSADLTEILFYPCGRNGSYTIPNGVIEIGEFCFITAFGLTESIIPTSVTKIESVVFYNCIGLTSITIPNSVTVLGGRVFDGCDGLTTINIPSGVSSIGSSGIGSCALLTSITVDSGNTFFISNDDVLFNFSQTKLIQYPAGIAGNYNIPQGTLTIGDSAFKGCKLLTGVDLPNSLTGIDDSAFYQCRTLLGVEIPNSVTNLGDSVFAFCSDLKFATLPDGITSIPRSSFIHCSDLEAIEIPSGVTVIEDSAFSSCRELDEINLPSGLLTIGMSAFENCDKLHRVVFPSSLTQIDNFAFSESYYFGESRIQRYYFLGDAPQTVSYGVFGYSSSDPLTVYYLSSKVGFTTPTWNGYDTVVIDDAVYPSASWLIDHDIDYETSMNQDLNNDGVSLEVAEALGLAPNERLSSKLPEATMNGNLLSIEFYGITPGYEYKVFASTDLTNWTETGVTIGAPDTEGMCIASTPATEDKKFLRLSVGRETTTP